MDIILYLIQLCHQLYKQNYWLINFICKYIPLKQWAFDDSHSPKYQKFKIDELPKIISFKQEWNWTDLISYYQMRYCKTIKPVFQQPLQALQQIQHLELKQNCRLRLHFQEGPMARIFVFPNAQKLPSGILHLPLLSP